MCPELNDVKVPTEVIFGCAAVCNVPCKVVADIMEVSGVTRLITIDLHAEQIQGFFSIPVDNVYGTPVMFEDIKKKKLKDMVVVSPDIGGVVRARAVAKRLNDSDLAIIDLIEALKALERSFFSAFFVAACSEVVRVLGMWCYGFC